MDSGDLFRLTPSRVCAGFPFLSINSSLKLSEEEGEGGSYKVQVEPRERARPKSMKFCADKMAFCMNSVHAPDAEFI